MLLINKILTLLNLLGAFVLMTLLSADSLRRHDWNRAAEIARLANDGPPLNETDEDISTPYRITDIFTGPKTETQSARIDEEVRAAMGLGNIKAQASAVDALKKKIDPKLDAVKEDPGKSIAETARFLLPLANSYGARERLITLRTFQAPDAVNKRLIDHLDKALTVTFQKWKPPAAADETAASFATAFHQAVQLGGPGEGRRQLADAFLRALTLKAGGPAKLAEAAAKGSAGGEDAATIFLRAARGDEGKARPALMEETFFETTNLLLEAQLAAAIRPALDTLRNRSPDPGQKAFFNYTKVQDVPEIAPADETPVEKTAREQRAAIVKMARAAVDKEENLPDADKQRVLAFRVAYLMALDAQPGEVKDPYSLAMADLLTADPTRVKPAFDAAEAVWSKKPEELASEDTALAFAKKLVGSDDAAVKTVEAVLAPKVKEMLAQLADELRVDLNYEFDLASNPKALPRRAPKGVAEDPAQQKPVTQSVQQRAAIAKVLFCLTDVVDPVPPDAAVGDLSANMKTAIRIVGLHTAALELAREASVLQPMPGELRDRTIRNRDQFVIAHQLLEGQVQEAAVASREMVEKEAKYKGFNDARSAIVGKPGGATGRYSDVEAFEKRLAEQQKVTQDRLTELEKMSKALFDIRLKVRDAITLTQQYEDGIRYLELRRR